MISTKWTPTTKRVVLAGLVIILLVFAYLLRALLPPLVLGVVLAYLLKPLADRLERRAGWPRTAATLVVFLALLLLVSLIPIVVLPYLVDQIGKLGGELEGLVADAARLFARPIIFMNQRFRLQDLFGDVPATLQNLIRPFATQTVNLLVGIASSLIWVAVVVVVAFYLVRDAAKLRAFLYRVSPPSYGEELRLLREAISKVWGQFFRGQLVLGIIIGMAVWIAMMIVGLPSAGLMGLTAGVLEAVPNFGPVLAAIPAVLTALLRGSTWVPLSNFWFMILVLGIYAAIQQAENAYVVPRVMGRRLQVHPALIFVGLLAGGLLFGAIGVFLAAPLIGTLRVLVNYLYAKLLDREPFPPDPGTVREAPCAGEIDAILFDLDGTLAETDDDATASLTRRLEPVRRILPKRDSALAARRLLWAGERLGARVLGLLDRVGLDDGALGVIDLLHRLGGMRPVVTQHPVEGVVEALGELQRRYRLAVVSTRSHAQVEAFVKQQGLESVIQAVVGRNDTWRIKPHPSPILHAAKLLGVPVDRCLMVGDTWVDMQAAEAAGARSVGVLCGFGSREELETAGADLILETTRELAGVL